MARLKEGSPSAKAIQSLRPRQSEELERRVALEELRLGHGGACRLEVEPPFICHVCSLENFCEDECVSERRTCVDAVRETGAVSKRVLCQQLAQEYGCAIDVSASSATRPEFSFRTDCNKAL